ncbi:MAG TPA: protoheme IX farnesyltransferase, partial [Gammaproteobacteria bacterium]|nr:protoheme IX farnesyltransferase [Gammaproteobacteria bacterium]
MAGGIYFGAASFLGTAFLVQTLILYRTEANNTALKTFSFSILYLLLLFSALLIDHYIQLP